MPKINSTTNAGCFCVGAHSETRAQESTYEVFRRPAGTDDWALVGTASFASDPAEMRGILGEALFEQLSLDLRKDDQGRQAVGGLEPLEQDGVYDTLLIQDFPSLALADAYPPVALAMGLAFFDEEAPGDQVLEYRVERLGLAPLSLGSVVAAPKDGLSTPANLRETAMFDGPAGLGVQPSPRPFNAVERYDWRVYDSGRRANGRVFLIWDLPDPDNLLARMSPIVGYKVYRRGPATANQWQITNPPDKSGGHHLVAPGYPFDGAAGQADGEFDQSLAAFFEDDLKSIFAGVDPENIYTRWDYRVCPVDLLGIQGICSDPLSVDVRDLRPPDAVQTVSVVWAEGSDSLDISWTYSDSTETSTPVRFSVITSPSLREPLSNWVELAPGGILAENAGITSSFAIRHQPELGVLQWYRVQVRDNAGNWSPLSAPVDGAIFPRTAPIFAPIPHNPQNCAENAWPLELDNLDPRVRQVVLYRAFQPGGHSQIIRRFRVEDRRATVTDDYEPPYTLNLHYQIEVLDGHGNVSEMQAYCTRAGSGNLPGLPTVKVIDLPDSTEYTADLFADADGYVDSSIPGANFGNHPITKVGNEASAVFRSFQRFDLSPLPNGAVVQSAALLMTTSTALADSPFDVRVHLLTEEWEQSKVTWDDQPSSDPTDIVTTVDLAGTKFTWDVTSLVQGWVNGTKNQGLSLQAVLEQSGADRAMEFHSRGILIGATLEKTAAPPKILVFYTLRPEVTIDYGEPGVDGPPRVTISRPGPNGNNITTDESVDEVESYQIAPGAIAQFWVWNSNDNGSGPVASIDIRNVNNFLDTNRHMANLGPIFGLEWRLENPEPSVRIHFDFSYDDPFPLVAAFRQRPGGSWMQVTSVLSKDDVEAGGDFNNQNTIFITDRADLSLEQDYNYSVLAFSPSSAEVLGFWETTLLPASRNAEGDIALSGPLDPAPVFPACQYLIFGPDEVDWKIDTILLENGWKISVLDYRIYGNCGDVVTGPSHLYGQGKLISDDLGDSWVIEFVDVAVDEVSGKLAGGRILLDGAGLNRILDHEEMLITEFGRIEFLPGEVNAEAVVVLPENIKFVDPVTGVRTNRGFGVIGNVQTNLWYDILEVETGSKCEIDEPGGLSIVDEDLPWRLYAGKFSIERKGMLLNGIVCTRDRLMYDAPAIVQVAGPDNNLGFMRVAYSSQNASVTREGLSGTFLTSVPIAYVTSLPASTVIISKGAELGIFGSQITLGRLNGAELVLDYFDAGTDTSHMIGQGLVSGYRLDPPIDENTPPVGIVPGTSIHRLEAAPTDDAGLLIGPGGYLSGNVALTSNPVRWPSFRADTNVINFHAAAAAFRDNLSADSIELNAPMPAENAWRRLVGPLGGDLDPGFNIIRVNEDSNVYYACYNRIFNNTDMDLYVRRGGVSENLHINAADLGQIRDTDGYLNTFVKWEALFVDNAIIDSDIQIDLYLPYPSDVTLRLLMKEFVNNCPVSGDMRKPIVTQLHDFWNLEFTPNEFGAYSKDPRGKSYYVDQLTASGVNEGEAEARVPSNIVQLHGRATVNGLVPDKANPSVYAEIPMSIDWLPDGDYGRIRSVPPDLDYFWVSGFPYALSGLKLNHYYSSPLDPDSLPDTLGLELEAAALPLAGALVSDGRYSQESLKLCSTSNEGIGCGFMVLDGAGAVTYFGEITATPGQDTPGDFPADAPQGNWPLAVNLLPLPEATTRTIPLMKPMLKWEWAFDDDYLEVDVPLIFLDGDEGGTLAGVRSSVEVLPGSAVAMMPVGVVINARFGDETLEDFGILTGHASGLGVMKALADNLPDTEDVSSDWGFKLEAFIVDWALNLGYDIVDGNDLVDLAEEVWDGWEVGDFQSATDVLEEKVLEGLDLSDFGLNGIDSSDILNSSSAILQNGVGKTELVRAGGDYIIEKLSMRSELALVLGTAELFDAAVVDFDLTRDKQFGFFAEGLQVSLGGPFAPDLTANLGLSVGLGDNDRGLDGGIALVDINLYGVDVPYLGAVFGAGEKGGEKFFYLGGGIKGEWAGFAVAGAVLFGTLDPTNPSIRSVGEGLGLGDLLAKFVEQPDRPVQPLYTGAYLAVSGDFPIIESGCLLNIDIGGELRAWYFAGETDVYGGFLKGSASGEVGCVMSVRGSLSVSVERLAAGGVSDGKRRCPDDDDPNKVLSCTAFSGDFWFAVGTGWCERRTWRSWETRWWGDSWCYTFGAQITLNYVSPSPADEDDWEYTTNIDWE